MALWHIPTACRLASATAQSDSQDCPTPHQLSMLIGLSSGSLDEVRKYFMYRFTKLKANQPRMLSRSVCVLSTSAVLAFFIVSADTAIHTFTSTIPFSRVQLQAEPYNSFGRGLINECINFNRSENQGLPCTIIADVSVGANVIARNSGEVISLQHNVSSRNSIWILRDEKLQNGDLLVLMPQVADTPFNIDYHAATVGVSTQCVPSSRRCDVRMAGGSSPEDSFIVFNCTDNFRGVLGAAATIANNTSTGLTLIEVRLISISNTTGTSSTHISQTWNSRQSTIPSTATQQTAVHQLLSLPRTTS